MLFINTNFCKAQKYKNGTRLLKGAEVLSNTPLQLDYVLENLSDTANVTSLHEGKTHLILNDSSGGWREWWYIKGKWQPKALTTTNTDTLLINNSTKDTLLIVSKDTIVRENNYKIAGNNGSLLCLKDSVPVKIPYLRMESTVAHIGQSSTAPMDIDFYLTILNGLPMKLTCAFDGLYFKAGKGEGYANVEQYIKQNNIYYRTFKRSQTHTKEGILSLSPDFTFLSGEEVQISSDNKTELVIRDTAFINLNRNEFEPDHCYFRFENQQLKDPHPFSELYINQNKLEFRKGEVSRYDSDTTTLISPSVFSAGANFNYLDNLKYNTQEKTFYVKNKIVFTDTENNNVASIFVNPAKNDIEFTSNALGGEIISLLEISKKIRTPNSGEFNPDDDGGLHVTPITSTPTIPTSTTTPTAIAYPTLPTYLVLGDTPPTFSDNALYLQLNTNKEIWLHIKLNGISKTIKIE